MIPGLAQSAGRVDAYVASKIGLRRSQEKSGDVSFDYVKRSGIKLNDQESIRDSNMSDKNSSRRT